MDIKKTKKNYTHIYHDVDLLIDRLFLRIYAKQNYAKEDKEFMQKTACKSK